MIPTETMMHRGRTNTYSDAVRFLGIQVLRNTVKELRTNPPVPNKTITGMVGRVRATITVKICVALMYPLR